MDYRKIIFVVAHDGYQHEEYEVPKRVLEGAGFQVITASDMTGEATAKDGSKIPVDLLVSEINVEEYVGLFFIGGPGVLECLDNEASYHLINKAYHMGKPIGAICLATRILAKAGILKDKRATGWNGDGELIALFKEQGIQFVADRVVVDTTIITANGPAAAQEFGEKIIALLQEQRGWG